MKISICSAGRHIWIALPLERVILLCRRCQIWLLSCFRNHSTATNCFPWKGITWHLHYFPGAEHSKGLLHRTVPTARTSLTAGWCEDRSVMVVLNVLPTFKIIICATLQLQCHISNKGMHLLGYDPGHRRTKHCIQLSRHMPLVSHIPVACRPWGSARGGHNSAFSSQGTSENHRVGRDFKEHLVANH